MSLNIIVFFIVVSVTKAFYFDASNNNNNNSSSNNNDGKNCEKIYNSPTITSQSGFFHRQNYAN